MPIKITKDNVDKVLKAVDELTNRRVMVGIPEQNDARGDDAPIGNAGIGYLNEFGGAHIPPRPHLVPGVQSVLPVVIQYLQKAGHDALSGNKNKIDVALGSVGMACQSSVRSKITAVIPPPLAPSTLSKRRAKGHMGTTPLIETGEYLNHITYVLRKKGG